MPHIGTVGLVSRFIRVAYVKSGKQWLSLNFLDKLPVGMRTACGRPIQKQYNAII